MLFCYVFWCFWDAFWWFLNVFFLLFLGVVLMCFGRAWCFFFFFLFKRLWMFLVFCACVFGRRATHQLPPGRPMLHCIRGRNAPGKSRADFWKKNNILPVC